MQIPQKPQGTCDQCKQPLVYTPNPNWNNIKHLFKLFPERGYWVSQEHPHCEHQLEERKKAEKETSIRLQGYEAVRKEMRELGFARMLTEEPEKTFILEKGNAVAHETMKNWKYQEKGILLCGPPGRGKSHLMAAHGKKWIEAGLSVAFQTMSGLLALLRRGYDEDLFDERLQLVSSKAQILMLDDLGAEKNSAWGEEKLYMIINTRLSSKLPLFITTNLTENELEERYHPRIASRLKEMCTWIKVEGPDWRATTQTKIAPKFPTTKTVQEQWKD